MRLTVDKNICVGCEACVLACAAFHTDEEEFNALRANIYVPFTFPLPSAPVICLQCKNAACINACPENALSKSKDSGIVFLEREKCIGCGLCMNACVFHAIIMDPIDNKVRKCDVCDGKPQCISFCQKGALSIK